MRRLSQAHLDTPGERTSNLATGCQPANPLCLLSHMLPDLVLRSGVTQMCILITLIGTDTS